jgi:hypothetical protein
MILNNLQPSAVNLGLSNMRKIIAVSLSIFMITFLSCEKNELTNAEVTRDCGITYLRITGKDYSVCNPEKVKDYQDGDKVKVSFNKLNECSGVPGAEVVCVMSHPNEGWINVNSIE